MIISPHPDDAEFGAAGTVARWTRESKAVVYVICTNGNKGSDDRDMKPETLAPLVPNRSTTVGNYPLTSIPGNKYGIVIQSENLPFLQHLRDRICTRITCFPMLQVKHLQERSSNCFILAPSGKVLCYSIY